MHKHGTFFLLDQSLLVEVLVLHMTQKHHSSIGCDSSVRMNAKLYGNTEREGDSVGMASEITAVSSALLVFNLHGKHRSRKTRAWSGRRRLWMSKRLCCPRPEDIYPDNRRCENMSSPKSNAQKQTIFRMKPRILGFKWTFSWWRLTQSSS